MKRSCACVLLALCACAGTETGNPVVPTSLELNARSSMPEAVAVSTGAGGTVIDQAWIAFGEFVFLEDCTGFGELDSPGTGTLLVANLAEPDVRIDVPVEPRSYCGLLVPLQMRNADLPKGAPAELSNHSVVVLGARQDGVKFVLHYPEQDELELAARAGTFRVEQGGPLLLLSFDVANWMNNVGLDRATPASDGVIHIDERDNGALLEAFEANLECSLQLRADSDHDGALGAADELLAACLPE